MSSIVTKAINNVDCHALKLFQNVASLFQVNDVNNKYSDLMLEVGNRIFYCHRLILQLNGYDFTTESDLEQELENINPDQFYEALQYMYTGEVLVSSNNIESLLSVARVLHMNSLVQVCFNFLEKIITREDAKNINDETYSKLASIYERTAIRCFVNLQDSNDSLLNASETFMKAILSSDDLKVNSEEEVCDVLLKWLQLQTDAKKQIHPDKLLPLIRWSGISSDYATSNIFTNKIIMSNSICVTFLSKVTTYMMTGVQFDGLNSFHRLSTGLENCLMVIGTSNGYTCSSNVYSIDLRYEDNITEMTNIPTTMTVYSVACVHDKTVYITGAGHFHDETWKWEGSSGWIECYNKLMGRHSHGAAILNSTMYIIGGVDVIRYYDDEDEYNGGLVEGYNLDSNNWFSAGYLTHNVREAAYATYQSNFIYVFGGVNNDDQLVDYVQVYEPAKKFCRLLDQRMPQAQKYMKAVLWETSALLLGQKTCYIYNFETDTWQERKQFKTDLYLFGIALENTRIFIVGGGFMKRNTDGGEILVCTDKIRSVSVMDIIANKPADWKNHGELPEPSLICSYGLISLDRA